jgi:hypothetical protein
MPKLTNHSTNCNTAQKARLFFSGKYLLPCLNNAEHLKVESNGEGAAQRVEKRDGSTFYIEVVKCLILRKISVRIDFTSLPNELSNVMLPSIP